MIMSIPFQVAYAMTTYDHYESKFPVVGFDMGGTSTDISRYDGSYEHVFESTTAGVCIQAPQVCFILIFYICNVMSAIWALNTVQDAHIIRVFFAFSLM